MDYKVHKTVKRTRDEITYVGDRAKAGFDSVFDSDSKKKARADGFFERGRSWFNKRTNIRDTIRNRNSKRPRAIDFTRSNMPPTRRRRFARPGGRGRRPVVSRRGYRSRARRVYRKRAKSKLKFVKKIAFGETKKRSDVFSAIELKADSFLGTDLIRVVGNSTARRDVTGTTFWNAGFKLRICMENLSAEPLIVTIVTWVPTAWADPTEESAIWKHPETDAIVTFPGHPYINPPPASTRPWAHQMATHPKRARVLWRTNHILAPNTSDSAGRENGMITKWLSFKKQIHNRDGVVAGFEPAPQVKIGFMCHYLGKFTPKNQGGTLPTLCNINFESMHYFHDP